MVQVHVGLHQRQSYARAANAALRLVEPLEDVRQVVLAYRLHRVVVHCEEEGSSVVSQRYGYRSVLRCIFHRVRHEIEEHTRQLVAVGNDRSLCRIGGSVHLHRYSLARGHGVEVVSPQPQRLGKVEAVQLQHRLVVLHLSEFEDLAHQLYQDLRVALHHLQHASVRALHRLVFKQLLRRAGDEGERRAQLVTDVCEKL